MVIINIFENKTKQTNKQTNKTKQNKNKNIRYLQKIAEVQCMSFFFKTVQSKNICYLKKIAIWYNLYYLTYLFGDT